MNVLYFRSKKTTVSIKTKGTATGEVFKVPSTDINNSSPNFYSSLKKKNKTGSSVPLRVSFSDESITYPARYCLPLLSLELSPD